ncbi:alpha-galactosidase [Lentzea albidocapillata]|uniref:Alpha-galactosidase n=1 Tax=Lentzea albidocapillata TaxID=40571 RepID=A0A1W2DJD5_9PSEU|nr:alpha-galactosidase [Lentzea albidocapillata]SMC97066.1 alpha-galactosidase [Lentzea albidocapillata]
MVTIAFVGAGSVEFTRQLLRDVLSFPELADVTISLHDIDAERLEVAAALARLAGGAHVRTSLSRREALEGADVVVNMVAIGGHAATLTDFDVPESFGLRQTIGDTLGIGGIFRGLRTFPFLDGLAADVLAVCPDAWLLNYTNPMAMNIQYLTTVAPWLKVAGLCHSVHWTIHDLSALVGVPHDEVDFLSAGVNHQAWILRWQHEGRDLYPALDAAIAGDPGLARRVRVDLYRRFGFYPTETSEHSSEYVPWYLRHQSEVERLRLPVRDYATISAENVATYEKTRAALAAGDAPPTLSDDAVEYAPQMIHSLVTGQRRTIQVNVANHGLISNLPEGAAVEVPATLDRLGVHPHRVGALPRQLAALNRSFLNVVDLTVAAAVEGDPRHVRHAALCDPATAAALTVTQIDDLVTAMTAAHGDLLPAALRSA